MLTFRKVHRSKSAKSHHELLFYYADCRRTTFILKMLPEFHEVWQAVFPHHKYEFLLPLTACPFFELFLQQ